MTLNKISSLGLAIFFSYILIITPAKATTECFEPVSRTIFKFNMAFDDVVLEPIAKGYNKLPNIIKVGTSNFTSNIATLLSIPNSLLQGNISQVGHATGSVLVNTTLGILGFFNPADRLGLKAHKEDVGQTLGYYGVGHLSPLASLSCIRLLQHKFHAPRLAKRCNRGQRTSTSKRSASDP